MTVGAEIIEVKRATFVNIFRQKIGDTSLTYVWSSTTIFTLTSCSHLSRRRRIGSAEGRPCRWLTPPRVERRPGNRYCSLWTFEVMAAEVLKALRWSGIAAIFRFDMASVSWVQEWICADDFHLVWWSCSLFQWSVWICTFVRYHQPTEDSADFYTKKEIQFRITYIDNIDVGVTQCRTKLINVELHETLPKLDSYKLFVTWKGWKNPPLPLIWGVVGVCISSPEFFSVTNILPSISLCYCMNYSGVWGSKRIL